MSLRTLPISGVYCAPSPLHGHGIFAGRRFSPHESIFTLRGDCLTLQQVLERGEEAANSFQLDTDLYLYPLHVEGRFINHSCEPSAGLREDREMIALREIEVGEEICFDYSTCMSERLWTMRCSCSAPTCRGEVGDFHDLPVARQLYYLNLGVVQRFILREILERASRLVGQKEVPSAVWAALASRIVSLTAPLEGRPEPTGAWKALNSWTMRRINPAPAPAPAIRTSP